MVVDRSVAEQARKHGKGAGCQHWIDEGFLPFQRFDGTAARQRFFADVWTRDFRIKFRDRAESRTLAAIGLVQRLSKDILSAAGVVPKVERSKSGQISIKQVSDAMKPVR